VVVGRNQRHLARPREPERREQSAEAPTDDQDARPLFDRLLAGVHKISPVVLSLKKRAAW
jgi:hypothetical protein